MAESGGDKPLKRSTLMLFGLPEYAIYLGAIPVSLYLPFVYSKDLGLELADVGLILMLARITDVVTDPLIGYLSDRTQTRFGRRKPWLAGGATLMMFSAFQLFNPGVLTSAPVDNWYLLIWSMLLWLGWTMINIPYYAWGAELSDNYNERTRITGWRQAFGFLGNVSVLAVPVMSGQITGYGGLPREGLTIIGSMALVALPTLIAVTLWRVPEREAYPRARSPILKNAKIMFKNGSFRLLFMGFMLQSLGTGWAGALFMLFASYVVEAEGQTQAILLGYYGANILALPLWVALAQRIGKKPTWVIGGALFVVVTPGFLFLGSGDLWWFFIVLALYGVAGGNFGALSMAMKADVIEIASRRQGENIAGSYIAIWSLGQKLVGALALGLALPLLQYLGFDSSGTNNGPEQIRALSWLYVVPPWLLYGLSVAVIWRYPITSSRLLKMRAAFDRRDRRREQRRSLEISEG
jgi:GPH family glycoside/pentoside/hexuronide:cation symporter